MSKQEFNDRLVYEIFTKPAQEKKEKEARITDFLKVWCEIVEEKKSI